MHYFCMDKKLYYYDDWIEEGKPIPWLVLDSEWLLQTNLVEEQITDKLEKGMKVEYQMLNDDYSKCRIIKFINPE